MLCTQTHQFEDAGSRYPFPLDVGTRQPCRNVLQKRNFCCRQNANCSIPQKAAFLFSLIKINKISFKTTKEPADGQIDHSLCQFDKQRNRGR